MESLARLIILNRETDDFPWEHLDLAGRPIRGDDVVLSISTNWSLSFVQSLVQSSLNERTFRWVENFSVYRKYIDVLLESIHGLGDARIAHHGVSPFTCLVCKDNIARSLRRSNEHLICTIESVFRSDQWVG